MGSRHAGSVVVALGLIPQHVGSSRSAIRPVFRVLAGGSLTSGPPGKSQSISRDNTGLFIHEGLPEQGHFLKPWNQYMHLLTS